MGDNLYSDLKNTFSSVPVKALSASSHLILCNNLDFAQTFASKKGFAKDYRGLAELIGLQYQDIKKLEESSNRTIIIFKLWETYPNATVDKLFSYLEDMDRQDVIKELIPTIKKDSEEYFRHQKSLEGPPVQVNEGTSNLRISSAKTLTIDDKMTGELTIYDAYLSYADEDIKLAVEFANILEMKGLKLFMNKRDMLPGCFELDAEIELILHRCRRMLVLLTPNFLTSPALEFQVSFASLVGIEQRQRILIPVILEPCEIHPVLSGLSKIDFTKERSQEWMWQKLFASL